MEPSAPSERRTAPRPIPIPYEDFGARNLEAWHNIIHSYGQAHPEHRVVLHYEGEPVNSFTYLFKLGKPLNRDAFELTVSIPDGDAKDVPKLYRLLVEGAGPDCERYLQRELHRPLRLF